MDRYHARRGGKGDTGAKEKRIFDYLFHRTPRHKQQHRAVIRRINTCPLINRTSAQQHAAYVVFPFTNKNIDNGRRTVSSEKLVYHPENPAYPC
jgi:hypothetical protein